MGRKKKEKQECKCGNLEPDIIEEIAKRRKTLIQSVYQRYRMPPLHPVDHIAIIADFTKLIKSLNASCGGSGQHTILTKATITMLFINAIRNHRDGIQAFLDWSDEWFVFGVAEKIKEIEDDENE